jgi:hypothetical protein
MTDSGGIEVRVDRPGVEVQARAGYYAPADRSPKTPKRAESTAERALSGGLPTGDLPMALTVAPFAMPEGRMAVLAVVVGIDLRTALPHGATVELVATAFDETWKPVASTREQFLLPVEGRDRASPAEMAARLSLRPGRYEIRVAMTSPATGLAGSVYTSASIPDFVRAPLSWSGVVIERRPGGAVMPETLTSLLPARPTTARVFSPADRSRRLRESGRAARDHSCPSGSRPGSSMTATALRSAQQRCSSRLASPCGVRRITSSICRWIDCRTGSISSRLRPWQAARPCVAM